MSEIVKVCKIHGELNAEQVYYSKRKNRPSPAIICKQCNTRVCKEGYLKNREVRIDKAIEYKNENRAAYNAWLREDRKKFPEKYREYARENRKKYGHLRNKMEISRRRGISIDEYDALLESQNKLCAICQRPENRMSRDKKHMSELCLDHNHETGANRGFLCHSCNTGLGKFQDSIEQLQRAIDYLRKYEG